MKVEVHEFESSSGNIFSHTFNQHEIKAIQVNKKSIQEIFNFEYLNSRMKHTIQRQVFELCCELILNKNQKSQPN